MQSATQQSLCLVTPEKKHQDWFDECNQQILGLLAEKKAAHAAWLSDKDSAAKHDRGAKLSLRQDR